MPHTTEYLEAVLNRAKTVIPSDLWNQIHQQARGSAGGKLSGTKAPPATPDATAEKVDGACPPGMVMRDGKCVPKSGKPRASTTYKQGEPPRNKFGLSANETLLTVEARRLRAEQVDPHAWSSGRFQQSDSKYVVPAPNADQVCGTCRFFLRSGEGELGRCQVVEGDIAWFGTSDYYIAAEEEAAATFDVIQQSADPPDTLMDLWKEWSDHTNLKVTPWVIEKTVRRCKESDRDPDKPAADQQYCVFGKDGKQVLSRTSTRAQAMTELARIERFSKDDVPKLTVDSYEQLRLSARLAFQFPGSQGLAMGCSGCIHARHGSMKLGAMRVMPRTPELTKQALEVVPPAIPESARLVFVSATPTAVEAARGMPLAGPDGRTFQDVYLKALGLPSGDWGVGHAVPVEVDLASTNLDSEMEKWSSWLAGVLKTKDDRIVVALGKAAKRLLGDRADFSVPHPAAVRRKGDSGEVARKMKAVQREVIKRALTKIGFADLTKSMDADTLNLEFIIGKAAHESLKKSDGRLQRALDPIFKDDADELQVVYGVVLTPYGVDTQDDWPPPAEIQKAAHLYIPTSRVIGTDHEQVSTAFPVESWIESYPSQEDYQKAMANEDHRAYRRKFGNGVLRSGEWVQGTKVPDNGEWTAVKTGERMSYSIGGYGSREPGDVSQMPKVEFIDIG